MAPSSPELPDSRGSAATAPAEPSVDQVERQPRRVRWRSVLIFVAVACPLFALCTVPLWFLADGLSHPIASWAVALGMFAPAVASLVVAKLVDRESWRDATGLRWRGRGKRIALWVPLGALIVVAINTATGLVTALRGVPSDLSGSTFAHESAQEMAAAGAPMSPAAAVALIVLNTVIAIVASTLPALGEEIGWRGWLWRELKPLGFSTAIAVGGAIWALWHLPVMLLGQNYEGQPRSLAIGMFIIVCVALNFLLGAITERSGGNPLPAAVAHATVNSTFGLAVSVFATSSTAAELNVFVDTPFGAIGVIIIMIGAYAVWPRRARSTFGRRSRVSQ